MLILLTYTYFGRRGEGEREIWKTNRRYLLLSLTVIESILYKLKIASLSLLVNTEKVREYKKFSLFNTAKLVCVKFS